MCGISLKTHSNLNLVKAFVALMLILREVNSQQSRNLLVNGDFNMSNMNGGTYVFFSSSIPGWNCTAYCQIDDCLLINHLFQSFGWPTANWTGNVIDLISDRIQNITQNVILEYDYYLLSFNYYYPRPYNYPMTLEVYFNEALIFNVTQSLSYQTQPVYIEKQIQGISGVNILRLTTKINTAFDSNGFFVNNIKLTRISTRLRQLVNKSLLNDVTKIIAKIPGSRIIFMDFMSFFVHLDRLQFYYYHNRNYSQYSTVLLADINMLNDLKGLLILNILQHINPDAESYTDSFFSSKDYKYKYTPSIVLQRDESGGGFVSNCYPFFVYNIPGTVITYLLLMGLFQLVKNRPASRLVRKFSFFGILTLMMFEGNIESLTYYSIGEMTLFFSANLQHRLINVFIVFFQLIVTIVSVGSVLFFKYHYRRLIFYFIEDKRNNDLGIICQIIDSGVVCVLFGIVHQILFSRPQLQLFVLIILQCSWMAFKASLIFRKAYKKTFSEFIMLSTGFLRICFIITFYFYEFAGELRTLINDAYHKCMIIIMILFWLHELLASFFQLMLSVSKFFTRLALIQRKTKIIKIGKMVIHYVDDSIKRVQTKVKEKTIKDKKKSANPNMYKDNKGFSIIGIPKKGRIFQHQKVRIAHLRIQSRFNEDHKKIVLK